MISRFQTTSPSMQSKSFEVLVSTTTSTTTDTCDCNFDQSIKGADYCYSTDAPVMGGLDMVQYFTTFKNDADGTYDETQVGIRGTSDYNAVYQGYTYYFVNGDNQAMFQSNPSRYVPQYGGFCAWGMGSEFCPKYGWDVTCMGPHGSYYHWTIQNDKLYFFWFAKARENFLANMETAKPAGDLRWSTWFGESSTQYMNTNCYESVLENSDGSPGGGPSKTVKGAAADNTKTSGTGSGTGTGTGTGTGAGSGTKPNNGGGV